MIDSQAKLKSFLRLMPLTLFSGEETTAELNQQATTIGFWRLIVLALTKLLVTSLLFATS